MDHLSEPIGHDKLMDILNAIGLEVEGHEHYQEVKGNLQGLVVGEVLSAEKHPNADRLSVTTVNVGKEQPLQIVCGAPNVAAGQKVIVAQVGVTIYPTQGEPLTMRNAKIRGVESQGMICAEDEIGLGTDHNGIKILDPDTPVGIAVATRFDLYEDHIISIGLTPNRSDAMSHLGVARDICSWISHHENKQLLNPNKSKNQDISFGKSCPIKVSVENTKDCARYAGLYISNVTVGDSPLWIQQHLKAIGLRPINNIVDITNYILHDTGQPLHAFDADRIKGKQVRVKNLPAGTVFVGLDEKERKLEATDLMICDGEDSPMCMGGVFGGAESGVTASTKNIFLESAWFHPVTIRKSSFKHQLRTDAALHFEKSVDIGQTLDVLKKAGNLIASFAGGEITTDPVDVYPVPAQQPEIRLNYDYVEKLSGKKYSPTTVKSVLTQMGFVVKAEDAGSITVLAPTHKTDASIPADLVEEIMRIDGFDNIAIPQSITISPSVSGEEKKEKLKEKISAILSGMGFNEMLNNSITHSAHYDAEELGHAVKMLNNLSAELDVLRLTMLETGLPTVARNLNHKNENLKLFEFGKTYSKKDGAYQEEEHLCVFTTGQVTELSWNRKQEPSDLYFLKGIVQTLLTRSGMTSIQYREEVGDKYAYAISGWINQQKVLTLGQPSATFLKKFDIRVPVWFLDLSWDKWSAAAEKTRVKYKEIPKFPSVQRDLSFVADRQISFSEIEKALETLSIPQLKHYRLFDVFTSEKLGKDKKSLAMNFTFLDETKTMKDEETDALMTGIIAQFEKALNAEIRK